MSLDVQVRTCFQCPFGRVEADSHALGTTFDCNAAKIINRPLTIRQKNFDDAPPAACPMRAPEGIVLRVVRR